MKSNFKHSINYFATKTAITTFIIGVICLLLLKNNSNTGFVGIGYWLTLLTTATNVIMLLLLLINTARRIQDYKEHLAPLFLVLVNIPIAVLYLELL